jgi:predicted transcriptional regulator
MKKKDPRPSMIVQCFFSHISGQDIDFLTLLQSFGLDMASVASALGLDITTLNNMDREVLIHLLTAQGNAD